MNTTIINYLIESSLVFSILYLAYSVCFARYKNFLFNRIFLLSSSIFAVVVPLIHISMITLGSSPHLPDLERIILLPEITVRPENTEQLFRTQQLTVLNTALAIYIAGFVFAAVRFLLRLNNIISFIRKNHSLSSYEKFYFLIPTQGKISTCSFFNYLLWDNSEKLPEKEKNMIFRHEETHIKHRHSYDIIFSELILIAFWFNPVVYFYKSSLVTLHEYVADHEAATAANRSKYISLLSFKTLKALNINLGNNFYQTQIFKRMKMLKSEKRRSWWSRLALTIPLFAILFYVFACEKESVNEQESITAAELPKGVTIVKLENASPEVRNWYNETVANGSGEEQMLVSLKKGVEMPFKGTNLNIRAIWVNKNENNEGTIYAVVERSANVVASDDIAIRKTKDEIFTTVEHQPVPQGGLAEFYEYIRKNIQYPAAAREQNIEGKVFVELIVNQDGSLSDLKVLKGIGGGCDEEAIRIVKNSPLWKPGNQNGHDVRVKMVLPIQFSLDREGKTHNNSEETNLSVPNQLNKTVVVGY